MQSIYNYKTHIRKNINNCKKKKKSIKLTDSVKYDFSDLQNYKNAWQHMGIQ
jgi:hypothetical protein